jgi:type I restriction enzyme S subunit
MDNISAPKEWQLLKLGDICEIRGGKRLPAGKGFSLTATSHPYIRVTDFSKGSVNLYDLKYIDEYTFGQINRYIINRDDVYLSIAGTIGIAGIIPDELHGANLTENACRLVIKDKSILDKRYLALFLQSTFGQDEIKARTNTVGQPKLALERIKTIPVSLPPLDEQRRIAKRLNEQMAAVESARKAAEVQLELSNRLINSYLKQSLSGSLRNLQLKDGFVEVKKGIGKTWADYPVLGTTRNGVAPAKEKVGKQPERYKLVEPGTIFYNPMRINIGSIGMLDEGDEPGITSPDYVIMNSVKGVIHPRWFYYWLRSPYGEAFIKTVARGAVRERMMFTRLAPAYLDVPSYDVQSDIAEKLLSIKQLRVSLESQLAEINRLPASLLRESFTGRT